MGRLVTLSGSAIACVIVIIICLPDTGGQSCGPACRRCVHGRCRGPCTPVARWRLYKHKCIPRCDGYCLKCLDYRQCAYCRRGYAVNTDPNGDRICRPHCDPLCAGYCVQRGRGKCDSKCVLGYGLNANYNCAPCDENCANKTDTAFATGCNVRGSLHCDQYCRANYFVDTDTYTCIACDDNCYPTIPGDCSASANCNTRCIAGYAVDSLANGAFNTCLPCASNCLECNKAGSGKCDSGQCEVNYVLNADEICDPCNDHCVSGCTSAGLCGTCSLGYGKTVPTAAESTCALCDQHCLTTSGTGCATQGAGRCDTTCNPGYALWQPPVDYTCGACQSSPPCDTAGNNDCSASGYGPGTCGSATCSSATYTFDSTYKTCA